ncbi:MAG TPA: hypothetical protein VEU11_16395 [Terriglobales bacterium]|jgi:hypothetical protein|nr:hypothetical protein [Terriglobales bacterium]
MKSGVVLITAILALFLGTGLANAQHGQKDQGGDSHGQERHGRGHDNERQGPAQHGRHDERGPEHRDYRESVQRGPEHGGHASGGQLREVRRSEPGPRYARQDVWQRQRAHDWQREHRSWHERGGYHGYRIPDDRFRAHFGRGHWFHVHDVPVLVVDGSPRFQYGGFWFGVVDPCPETWSPVWYRTDDVYVDYVNDGYYMYNRQHPGVAIAVNVSF